MGCFTILKRNKKKSDQIAYVKRVSPGEDSPKVLPEPQTHTRSLQSAPPSFKIRVKPSQPTNKVTNNRSTRIRALSAPSALDEAEQDALASIEYEGQEDSKYRTGSWKEQRTSSPQPLPLPSPKGGGTLKTVGSFKSGAASSPLYASGPLPLPPTGSLRNFSYDELAAACLNFSSDRYMSESLSSTIYKASFGDDTSTSSSKKFEATVTRLRPSPQVLFSVLQYFSFISLYSHAYKLLIVI
jgi:hypothetical protein